MSDRLHQSAQAPSLQALSEEFEQLLARGAGLLDRTGAVEAQLIGHRIAPLLDVQRDEDREAAGEFNWPPLAQTLDDCELVPLPPEEPAPVVERPDSTVFMAEPAGEAGEATPSPTPRAHHGWGWFHAGLASAAALVGVATALITMLVEPTHVSPSGNRMGQWRPAEVPVAAAEELPQVPPRTLAPPIIVEAPLRQPTLEDEATATDAVPQPVPAIHTMHAASTSTSPVLETAVLPGRSAQAVPAVAPATIAPDVGADVARSVEPHVPSLPAAVAPLTVTSIPANVAAPGAPVAPAAPPTPPAAAVAAGPNERDRITSTLGRFRTAYADLDARAAQAVWPTVDVAALERAFGGLRQQELTFDRCTVEVTGIEASAHCLGRATYVGRIGRQTPHTANREWDFRLRKADTGWTISSARIR